MQQLAKSHHVVGRRPQRGISYLLSPPEGAVRSELSSEIGWCAARTESSSRKYMAQSNFLLKRLHGRLAAQRRVQLVAHLPVYNSILELVGGTDGNTLALLRDISGLLFETMLSKGVDLQQSVITHSWLTATDLELASTAGFGPHDPRDSTASRCCACIRNVVPFLFRTSAFLSLSQCTADVEFV